MILASMGAGHTGPALSPTARAAPPTDADTDDHADAFAYAYAFADALTEHGSDFSRALDARDPARLVARRAIDRVDGDGR
ncbi:MAG: hypothetical protein IT357_12285 [Gemmatimonadaceae bacterium]|nr:hypothetical protein [Gemmatimonadaceae bacterium]